MPRSPTAGCKELSNSIVLILIRDMFSVFKNVYLAIGPSGRNGYEFHLGHRIVSFPGSSRPMLIRKSGFESCVDTEKRVLENCSQVSHQYALSPFIRDHFKPEIARSLPIQPRCPLPKVQKFRNNTRTCCSSTNHLSGLNASGSGKISGCRCTRYACDPTTV